MYGSNRALQQTFFSSISPQIMLPYWNCSVTRSVLVETRGGKNTHVHGYLWVISVMGTGRVVKQVSTSIINGIWLSMIIWIQTQIWLYTYPRVPISDYLILLLKSCYHIEGNFTVHLIFSLITFLIFNFF